MDTATSYTRTMVVLKHVRISANIREGYSSKTLKTWTAGEVILLNNLLVQSRLRLTADLFSQDCQMHQTQLEAKRVDDEICKPT